MCLLNQNNDVYLVYSEKVLFCNLLYEFFWHLGSFGNFRGEGGREYNIKSSKKTNSMQLEDKTFGNLIISIYFMCKDASTVFHLVNYASLKTTKKKT